MQSFNWVDIDGIRYSWDGQGCVVCSGRFGYQATMAGDKITALELENEDGEVVGTLDVDFATHDILFTPAEGVPFPHMVVLVGHELGQQEYSLQSLSEGVVQGLLSHSENIDWSSLAVVITPEPMSPPQGQVLSWDSFHFEEDGLLGARGTLPVATSLDGKPGTEISINIDMTASVLEQIPPLHDI